MGEAVAQSREGVEEDVARLARRDLVVVELERRHAAPDADVEPAVAEVIEHRDLLDQAQRRIERQQIDERAEADAPGRLRDRAEPDARHRHHVERRRVVLGDVIGVEAGVVGGRHVGEAFGQLRVERPVGAVDVVEDAEFHRRGPPVLTAFPLVRARVRPLASDHRTFRAQRDRNGGGRSPGRTS